MAQPRFDVSCKIGTMPALVRVHGSDSIEVGRAIRIQERLNANWSVVIVDRLNPDGYFLASRWMSCSEASGLCLQPGG